MKRGIDLISVNKPGVQRQSCEDHQQAEIKQF